MSNTVGYKKPPEEHRFQPGVSGNPAGRPKGLARKTRELLGDDGESLVRFWASVMDGGPLPDGTVPSVRERLEASKLLADRGWGKAPQFVLVEDEDPLESEIDVARIAAEFHRDLDEIAERRRRQREEEARSSLDPPARD
jgi:Family of unknown function (DUF5681)